MTTGLVADRASSCAPRIDIPLARAIMPLRKLDFVHRIGGDVSRYTERAGLPRNILENEAGWVSYRAYLRLIDDIARREGAADLSFVVNNLSINEAVDSAIGKRLMSAMTLSQALTRLAAIGRTQLTELTIAQSVESDVVCLDVRLPLTPQTPGFAISETGSVVILLDLLRSFLGRTFQPKVIHLASRSQDLPYDIETAFGGVPVRVNRRSAAVFFPAAFLTSLSPVLTGAHRLDARPPGPLEAVPSKMSDRLRVLVSGLLPDGAPTVQQTAESLGVSPRTLQRRLADEGTSYFQVVDDARCATALRGLRDPDQTLDDIAYDAGYAERAPFIRAFKRWTGLTPRDYQRHHEKRPEN